MSILTDLKYAGLLSSRLEKHKVINQRPFKVTFRCHVCGDSQSNKNARKATIIDMGANTLFYKCVKCHYVAPFQAYLRSHWPDLYSQYVFEEFSEMKAIRAADPILTYTKPKSETTVLRQLKRISQLTADHRAKMYVVNRKLPPESHSRLYFTNNFKTWINGLVPDKYPKVPDFDPRLVIPLINRDGGVFAVQGRALTSKQDERYITIRFNENIPKVFGLDKVDPNHKVYALEGPLDSLFLPNAVAMAGSECSLEELLKVVGTTKDRLVFVFDNEPRNIHIHKRMEQLLDKGCNVCIWPKYIKQKDINKMILESEFNAFDLQLIIDRHTYTGMEGALQMASWVKA